MKKQKFKKKVVTLMMVSCLALGATSAVASATTKYSVCQNGDKWQYGENWVGNPYSNYYVPNTFNAHHAFTKNERSGAYERKNSPYGGWVKTSVSGSWGWYTYHVGCGLGY